MGRGDLPDAEWERLRPFLPVSNGRCGRALPTALAAHHPGPTGRLHAVRGGIGQDPGVSPHRSASLQARQRGCGQGIQQQLYSPVPEATRHRTHYPGEVRLPARLPAQRFARRAATGLRRRAPQEAQHCRAGDQQAQAVPRGRHPPRQALLHLPRRTTTAAWARRPASSLQAPSHYSLEPGQARNTPGPCRSTGREPRAAMLFHPRNACLYRRATISSSMRAVIEVRWEPPPSTWAVTVTTASLSGQIMQSWP